MRLGFLKTFLLITLTLGAHAEPTGPLSLDANACQAAIATLPHPPVLRAEFTQQKLLPDIAKPIEASGELIVADKLGVILKTLRPDFARSTRVIPLVSNNTNPGNLESRINLIVQSILSGEFSSVSNFFNAKGTRTGSRLTILLTPKSPQVAQAISQISLTFETYLNEIVVSDTSGGYLRFNFSNYSSAPPLSPEELKNFSPTNSR